jgi:hypothetical protein
MELITRGVSLCDHLRADFIGVKFTASGDGKYKKSYIVVPDMEFEASNRGGTIHFYVTSWTEKRGNTAQLLDV